MPGTEIDRLQKIREIEMCNRDWRWPRLIVPRRCALSFYLRWGDKREQGGKGEAKKNWVETGDEIDRRSDATGVCKHNGSGHTVSLVRRYSFTHRKV